MKKMVYVVLGIVFSFTLSPLLPAGELKSSTESYIDELHNQGKERVIVSFKEDAEVDISLVEKYECRVIYVFNSIKGVVCEIPQKNIEPLRNENSVKGVYIDAIIKTQPDKEERDPLEASAYLYLKKKYISKIQQENRLAVRKSGIEFLNALRLYLAKRKAVLNQIHLLSKNCPKSNKYAISLSDPYELLKRYNAELESAIRKYKVNINKARAIYAKALNESEVRINENLNFLLYSGPVTVRWNNLSDGMNSKAVWDNYGLDGAGIKIAFLDQGVNYTLPDVNKNYLGGKDFVAPDDDPFTDNPEERHGTQVVSLAVGEGELKVVGPAYNAAYYAVRVTDSNGTGLVSNIMSGIEWASTEPHKADIISMSLGAHEEDEAGNPLWSYIKQEWEDICNNAYNAGVILVAASGNREGANPAYPAAFNNVMCVAAHNIHQAVSTFANGGADIVAPGESTEIPTNAVVAIGSDGKLYAVSGTSVATPHAAALIALQLQYARERNVQPNNGYLWEVVKHSALDLGLDPVYQGKGKIRAARTDGTSSRGSIDLLAAKWPLTYDIAYDNYAYIDTDGYPAFYIGTSLYQDITLSNNTHIFGSYVDDIENLNVTTAQAYYGEHNEDPLPGDSTEVFPAIASLTAGNDILLEDDYFIPLNAYPGLDRTILGLEFEFASDPLDRLIKVTYPYAAIWCPPPAINSNSAATAGRSPKATAGRSPNKHPFMF